MKITVFGFAGSGTSTIGNLLSEKLGYDFMSSGNIMRQWASDMGHTIYEFEDKIVKNNETFDTDLDTKVREYGINNKNFLFESRLAWYFIPDSFKIYLKCNDNERYNRIQNREKISIEEVVQKTTKRENDLVKRYTKVYPEISFPPSEDIFDLVIDVTNINPQEIVKIIISKIGVKYMEL